MDGDFVAALGLAGAVVAEGVLGCDGGGEGEGGEEEEEGGEGGDEAHGWGFGGGRGEWEGERVVVAMVVVVVGEVAIEIGSSDGRTVPVVGQVYGCCRCRQTRGQISRVLLRTLPFGSSRNQSAVH